MATKETMRAVIFKGPHKIAVEDRPVPKIQDPQDIIVKVGYTALCGRYVGYPTIKLGLGECN
jgi:threonine dehydrogenase-like Zn-dependent dehydrogenase